MYSAQVLDHFEHPRNAGALKAPDAQVQIENPACGDTLQLTLKIADGRIVEIGFLAKGCVASMACASALTELVRGRGIAQLGDLRREEIVHAVGGLPPASMHASHLALDALTAALAQLARKA
jgi:NifU-like protein involved in Fe-S cluster formation